MNDKQLENLLRMACEIDEVERLASPRAPGAPFADNAHRWTQPADHKETIIRLEQFLSRRRIWRMALSVAAAAACLLLLIEPPANQRAPQEARAIPFKLAYCPGVPFENGQRIDRFEPNAPEYCVVLAIFRTWHEGCQCLAWQLHEWEDGRTLAEVVPGEVPDIALDVTGAPPVEQLLVVAISQHPGDLPSGPGETDSLIDCLNELTPPTESCESAEVCALTVESCLPKGVTVVPRSFFVE
jgi:hypothetical protein